MLGIEDQSSIFISLLLGYVKSWMGEVMEPNKYHWDWLRKRKKWNSVKSAQKLQVKRVEPEPEKCGLSRVLAFYSFEERPVVVASKKKARWRDRKNTLVLSESFQFFSKKVENLKQFKCAFLISKEVNSLRNDFERIPLKKGGMSKRWAFKILTNNISLSWVKSIAIPS